MISSISINDSEDKYLNKRNNLNKIIYLNNFKKSSNSKDFYIDDILFSKDLYYRDLLVKKIENFHKIFKTKNFKKINYELNGFDLSLINSLLHTENLKIDNFHYNLLKILVLEEILNNLKIKEIYINTNNNLIKSYVKNYSHLKKIKFIEVSNIYRKKKKITL